MDGQILDRVHFYKYLGLMVDDHLNFNKHIQEMNKVVSHKLFMFSKMRNYMGEKDAILLFKTMILPIIEYCDIIYEDPEEECYYSKHVDHAVIYIHVYIINLIQQSSTTSVVELGIQIPHLLSMKVLVQRILVRLTVSLNKG